MKVLLASVAPAGGVVREDIGELSVKRGNRSVPSKARQPTPYSRVVQTGRYGYFSVACTTHKDVEQVGNEAGLDRGARTQPMSFTPHAV